ncbi:ganglioside GM2 activator-like [Babylonia areolata]|uniref:ganglioside GM2 activator-like n=1 Tax=Babylonia areolata TaxID=304850 RepID=UPI003FD661B0
MTHSAHLLLCLGLACVSAVVGKVSFSVTDCASQKETELMTFPEARLSPYPVPVPGDLSVSGSLRLNRNATGSVSLDVTIERYVGFFWLSVPCISNVGSCTYNDACGLLETNYGAGSGVACPPQVTSTGLRCTCPFPAGTYSMNNAVFNIPELSGLWSWLAEGDYRVTLKLTDNPTGQQLACQKVEATIVDGHPSCSGFLCSIFG